MTSTTNILLQIAGIAGQVFNQVGGLIPPKIQGWVALGLGLFQAIVAKIAHNSNPDGTPATVAYVPPVK